MAQHRAREAETIIDNLASGFPWSGIGAFTLGEKYAIVGDFKKADMWFSRAYDGKDLALFVLPGDKLVPQSYRDRPEYKALLDRPRFREWQSAHDRLASDLAAR